MKRFSVLFLTVLLAMVLAVPAAMAGVTVYVDGQQVQFDQQPYVDQGAKRTLVPFRQIFESLGADVWYDEATNSAMGQKDGLTIQLPIGQAKALVNGNGIDLDVTSQVVNGRTMVPLRFISENLGCTVTPEGDLDNLVVYIETIDQTAYVHFIDVGQGDAIYIELPSNNDILIDAGDVGYGPTVVNYLKNRNVDDIELLIATHPHADHIGGMPEVFQAYDIKAVIDSGVAHTSQTFQRYLDAVKAEGAVFKKADNQSWDFAGYQFEVLGPVGNHDDLNNMSVVTKLTAPGGIAFLFTGDAEKEAEGAILHKNLNANVLKVGHHGSDTSTSTAFLNKVNPEVAIISVGAGNTYGHPTAAVLQKLRGIEVYRTDLNGNIVVKTDGKTYSIETQKAGVDPAPAPVITTEPQPVPEQPAATSGKYIGSAESDKYHYPSCRHAERITPANQVWFVDVADAKAHGYVPCGVCKP